MRERILNRFDNRLIKLGFLPFHLKADLLARVKRQISNHARKLIPHIVNGLHPSLHDCLLQLFGEEIKTLGGTEQDGILLSTSQRLNFLTKQLQEAVMKTRMQPIDNVWNKFPRVVRDLALHSGKQVRLQMEGKETELDKAVIEAIQDPLTHLVRNSIAHGLETPEKRVAARKPAEGQLWLRAFHEGGNVHIEVADDGAGIDPDAVRRKGVERGMISSEQARLMDDQEAVQLIFLPGFSTA